MRKEDSSAQGQIVTEILQHLHACNNSVKVFYGREENLEHIKNYMLNYSEKPLVLYGEVSDCAAFKFWVRNVKLNSVFCVCDAGRLRQDIVAGQKCIAGIDRLVRALQTDQYCAIFGHNARLERLDTHPYFNLSANFVQFYVAVREHSGRFGAADGTFQTTVDVRNAEATALFLSRFGRPIDWHR